MFASWFTARCPVATSDKAWIETRMGWLAEQFGLETMRRAELIFPTADYFPPHWNGTEAEARDLYAQVADWMGVAPDACILQFADDTQLLQAMGHYDATPETESEYGHPVIRVATSVLQMPIQLVATMAHELAHHRLLGGGHLTAEVQDHELVTDLLPVFLGLGIIQANAPIHEATIREGRHSWYQATRSGYLTSMQLGYALALFAWHRGDEAAQIGRELRLDARTTFRAGLRFLTKAGDTLFPIGQAKCRPVPKNEQEWLDGLSSTRADIRLSTIWQWMNEPLITAAIVESLYQRLDDRDPDIPGQAARACVQLGELSETGARHLSALLHSRNEDAVLGALETLHSYPQHPEIVLPHLIPLLHEERDTVKQTAIWTLTAYGTAAAAAIPTVVPLLVQAVRHCVFEDELATALCVLTDDPAGRFQQLAAEDLEADTYATALNLIAESKVRLAQEAYDALVVTQNEDNRG